MKLFANGAYVFNGYDVLTDYEGVTSYKGYALDGETLKEAKKKTLAYKILMNHNVSGNDDKLKIKFDKLASHDITFVGIIQTARASGLTEFPIPYALTNCHNSLCAVGGTINEDDHQFGLSCAKKYGGIFVPPHQAVIHQYAREMLAECGKMILGSDSHTRYGALGTMAVGEGGPELVKQLLKRTYDIDRPKVVGIHLTNKPIPGVGPQDVALALIKEVFSKGFVKNKVLEFFGEGIKNLSVDFRIGIDVMTTETTCLSSIWETDALVEEFYEKHGRKEAYSELKVDDVTFYDSLIEIDLSEIRPMIALPFHPSNAYTIKELKANLEDILRETEEKAKISLENNDVQFNLRDKIVNGNLLVEQGIIAGCAGGGFENICAAADIIGDSNVGNDVFSFSVYPASQPILLELSRNGYLSKLIETGATIRTAFCGPCFGAGDVPQNGGLSIRHSTRNFPNREGSKITNGQIASVALMDARSIAATAKNKGFLTGADELDVEYKCPEYHFDKSIYEKRVYNGFNKADKEVPLKFGPGIVDWPSIEELSDNILLKVVSEIHDPVTTTDELIPSGETSSYRSNPLKLAEFTLSRKDPSYVKNAKRINSIEKERISGIAKQDYIKYAEELSSVLSAIEEKFEVPYERIEIGSVVYANKPGDGSAREQAASCQRVLGGLANIAKEYATKRYRSNLINWGMIPFVIDGNLPFHKGDSLFIPNIRQAIKDKAEVINAYVYNHESFEKFELKLEALTDDERQIILDGCLMNYYKNLN
ncbi:MAG: hydratase [Lachnospiraceae bacterium]|nr:hydratase [Lachnospiraceae bacterium]